MKIHFVNKADCDLGDGDLQLIELEPGEIVLTKEEVQELAIEVSGFISYKRQHAWNAVRKIIRASGNY